MPININLDFIRDDNFCTEEELLKSVKDGEVIVFTEEQVGAFAHDINKLIQKGVMDTLTSEEVDMIEKGTKDFGRLVKKTITTKTGVTKIVYVKPTKDEEEESEGKKNHKEMREQAEKRDKKDEFNFDEESDTESSKVGKDNSKIWEITHRYADEYQTISNKYSGGNSNDELKKRKLELLEAKEKKELAGLKWNNKYNKKGELINRNKKDSDSAKSNEDVFTSVKEKLEGEGYLFSGSSRSRLMTIVENHKGSKNSVIDENKVLEAARKEFKKEDEGSDNGKSKLLDKLHSIDSDIELKDVKVEKSPKGNWVVYHKGESITTLSKQSLSDDDAKKLGILKENK